MIGQKHSEGFNIHSFQRLSARSTWRINSLRATIGHQFASHVLPKNTGLLDVALAEQVEQAAARDRRPVLAFVRNILADALAKPAEPGAPKAGIAA